jgi:hypothetical protein
MMMKKAQSILAALVLGVAMLAPATHAGAATGADDKIVMNDGRVFEGEIVRELDGFIWIEISYGGLKRTELVSKDDIKELTRDGAEAGSAASSEPTRDLSAPVVKKPDDNKNRSGAPRAAIISLGETNKDMVGLFMLANTLEEIIPQLEKDDVEVVVFLINSGGGALLEIQRLSDVIHEEYKPRFRTVAWIESAISAAAMTAHCLEEIYFMPEGNYGACTGWSGNLEAVEGRDLLEVVYMMEKISARGGYDPSIMKAMQHFDYPLSCDIDEHGRVTWHQNEEGEHVLNPEGRILTFNSQQAEQYGFSRGTARTLDELAEQMGYSEIEWVGRKKDGYFYPVCAAEEQNIRFRDKTFEDQERINEYWTIYQAAIQLASSSQDRARRGKFVGRARRELNQIKLMVRNNPNFKLFVFGMTDDQWDIWIDEQERLLRDLMR